jgi:hypothetical protein
LLATRWHHGAVSRTDVPAAFQATLVIAAIAVRDGIESRRGKHCCAGC